MGCLYFIIIQFGACIVPSFLTCVFIGVVHLEVGGNLMYNSFTALASKIITASRVVLLGNSFILCNFELLRVIDLLGDFPILIHQHFDLPAVGCVDEIHVVSSLLDLSSMIRESFSDENRFTI